MEKRLSYTGDSGDRVVQVALGVCHVAEPARDFESVRDYDLFHEGDPPEMFFFRKVKTDCRLVNVLQWNEKMNRLPILKRSMTLKYESETILTWTFIKLRSTYTSTILHTKGNFERNEVKVKI